MFVKIMNQHIYWKTNIVTIHNYTILPSQTMYHHVPTIPHLRHINKHLPVPTWNDLLPKHLQHAPGNSSPLDQMGPSVGDWLKTVRFVSEGISTKIREKSEELG